jgi:hypothetical protein
VVIAGPAASNTIRKTRPNQDGDIAFRTLPPGASVQASVDVVRK